MNFTQKTMVTKCKHICDDLTHIKVTFMMIKLCKNNVRNQ